MKAFCQEAGEVTAHFLSRVMGRPWGRAGRGRAGVIRGRKCAAAIQPRGGYETPYQKSYGETQSTKPINC